MPVEVETKAVLVPDGLVPGDLFTVTTAWGGTFTISCPEGSAGGDTIAVDLPTFESVAAEIDELEAVRQSVDQLASSRRIESFCLEHAAAFGELAEGAEYPLHCTEVHQRFVVLVEELLGQVIAEHGFDDEESFVALVARSGAESRGQLLKAVDAMTDFESFIALMRDARDSGGGVADAAADGGGGLEAQVERLELEPSPAVPAPTAAVA